MARTFDKIDRSILVCFGLASEHFGFGVEMYKWKRSDHTPWLRCHRFAISTRRHPGTQSAGVRQMLKSLAMPCLLTRTFDRLFHLALPSASDRGGRPAFYIASPSTQNLSCRLLSLSIQTLPHHFLCPRYQSGKMFLQLSLIDVAF